VPGSEIAKHFRGSATVGERGQIVIPAEVREDLDIKAGDKLLVFAHPGGIGVAFVKFDKLQEAQAELQHALGQLDLELAGEPGEEAS
jgi:AbrB family looped-hinge helix DNA binding protein